MSERDTAMKDFLAASGWGEARVTPLPGDASTRRYARLAIGAKKAMLMDQPQGAETPTAPPGAGEETRKALGYNAVARLAGPDCHRFAVIAKYLCDRGFSAPNIMASDYAQGFLILEDLGDDLFADILAKENNEEELYRSAVELLAKIHAEAAPELLGDKTPLYEYDDLALNEEVHLLLEWFVPLALGHRIKNEDILEHNYLWKQALAKIGNSRRVFVHRDYHAQNLLWLPQRDGTARVGLIDFQDAVAGGPAYDLVSLVEDARRDVSPQLAEAATAHYLAAMTAQGTPLEETEFRREMAVMAAQRNAKIVGIFARLYKRDGKARYLGLLPRVWGYLARDLAHPALADLRAWYDRVIPADKRRVEQP